MRGLMLPRHVLLFVATLALGLVHGASRVIFGFALYGFDVLFRYLYIAARRNPRDVTISRLPCGVVRISFPKVRGLGVEAVTPPLGWWSGPVRHTTKGGGYKRHADVCWCGIRVV